MQKLDYNAVLTLSENEESRTVRLSSFSLAMLMSWLISARAIFWTDNLTEAELDAADAAYSLCVKELMRSAMIGSIFAAIVAPADAPPEWIYCSGGYLTMADWPDLMEVYPSLLKNYPSTGVFTIPDLRDRMLIGVGTNFAFLSTGGERTHVLTTAEMPAHTHGESIAVPAVINGGLEAPASAATASTGTTGSAGSGAAHNNMPPYGAAYIYLLGR